jgi:hypothetical protein
MQDTDPRAITRSGLDGSASREDIVLSLQRISPSVQFGGIVVQRICCLWVAQRVSKLPDMVCPTAKRRRAHSGIGG